jgi:hypothetical protein
MYLCVPASTCMHGIWNVRCVALRGGVHCVLPRAQHLAYSVQYEPLSVATVEPLKSEIKKI